MTRGRAVILAVLACAAVLLAQNERPAPLTISTEGLPEATLHTNFNFELKANGGTEPFAWTVEEGTLPFGVTLDERSGTLAGAPAAIGTFKFMVRVSDSSAPPEQYDREFILVVVPGLSVKWKRFPQIAAGGIYGSVELESHLPENSDLTFIVVAVNEIGKAFVLGYQQLKLEPTAQTQELKFGSTLPAGSYIVHVDTVAELPATEMIYRARVQTSEPLTLTTAP